jgi:hypothetical protein
MVRKIKPQSAQRITESCYFYLSPPLCPLCPLWFSETLFRKYQKVSGFLVTAEIRADVPCRAPPESF